MKHAFRALSGRDFRLYFIGQVVSLIGTWVQQVALSWITYRVTGSAFMLGLVAFSGQIPMFLLAPVGGTLADRIDRRKLLIVTQVLAMAVATGLAVCAYSDSFSPAVLVAASILLGASNGIEMPTRQAFLLQIVHDREHSANAIALGSLIFNGARLVGPAVAGAVLATVGETACFVGNAVSYLAAIYTLLAVHPRATERRGRAGNLQEGLLYLRRFAPSRWLLITVSALTISVVPFMTFMPVYAKDIFHGGPHTLGILMGSSGLGAVLAALYLAGRRSIAGLGKLISWGCFATGIACMAFAYNEFFPLALALLVVSGCATIIVATSCNMLLQHLVPENLRGRVMALYTMSFVGMLPIGSLGAGWLAHITGVQPVFALMGISALVMGEMLRRRLPSLQEEARPVLAQKGLSSP
jgi:MFS family permease